MYNETRYLTAGDKGLIVEFSDKIEPMVNDKIRSLCLAISNSGISGVIEMVPTYRSLMIIYDPISVSIYSLIDSIRKLEKEIGSMSLPQAKVIEIPTLYGGDYGQDLQFVADHNKISVEEVINIHTSTEYLIYMIGFTPGFPYLGGMPEKIGAPRLQTPRTKIPAGSVGIAGTQTGIYPIESPGGWQLIGRTPVKLYEPHRNEPVLLSAGDYIKFTSIDEYEYKGIEAQEARGEYKIKSRAKDRG